MAKIRSFPNNQDEYIGAEDVMRWLHGRTSGVFGASLNAAVFQVLGSMSVIVTDGNGWLTDADGNGIVWWVDNEAKTGQRLELAVDMADAYLPRIDRVVVSWQTTNYVALPEIIILKGTPASNPEAPALTNDNILRQISLAQIKIPAGATSSDSYTIKDERLDSSVCGIVTEKVGVDTSMMNAQINAFFEKSIAEQNAYIEAQTHSWEAFFENVQYDTVVPVPTVSDKGKVIAVNSTGDGYILGEAQTEIPVTSNPPEDCDIWIDPNETSVEQSHINNRNNPHGVTIEQIGAVGQQAVYVESLNEITKTGYYSAPVSENWAMGWFTFHAIVSGGVVHLTGNIDGSILHRTKSGSVWGEWEWENPPMMPSTEYRTTERFEGKPVYTRILDIGSLPNTNTKRFDHNIGCTSLLSDYAFITAPTTPKSVCAARNYPGITECYASATRCSVATNSDLSVWNCYFILKYTKD